VKPSTFPGALGGLGLFDGFAIPPSREVPQMLNAPPSALGNVEDFWGEYPWREKGGASAKGQRLCKNVYILFAKSLAFRYYSPLSTPFHPTPSRKGHVAFSV
jgi:hypothetical protein